MIGNGFVYALAVLQCGAGVSFACEGKPAKAVFWCLLCAANLIMARYF